MQECQNADMFDNEPRGRSEVVTTTAATTTNGVVIKQKRTKVAFGGLSSNIFSY